MAGSEAARIAVRIRDRESNDDEITFSAPEAQRVMVPD